MTIDFRADPDHAAGHGVLDAATGEDLSHLRIWYADDAAGIIRVYDADEHGLPFLRPGTYEPAWTEHRRAIRIVPGGVGPETWRTRPALL
jgi:hypothetical protein